LLDNALLEPIRCEVPAFEAGEVVVVRTMHGDEAATVTCDAVRKLRLTYKDAEIGVVCVVAADSPAIIKALQRIRIPTNSDVGNTGGVLVSTPEIVRGHERNVVVVVGPEDSLSGKNYGHAIRSYIAMSRARDRLVVVATR